MNPLKLFPEAATWNIDKLIADINAARKKFDNKGELSEMNKYYLCGILAEYSPKAIGHKCNQNSNGRAVSTALSTEINKYIRDLLNYPEALSGYNFWGNARRELEKAGYKKSNSLPDSQDSSVIKIKLDSDNPSMADLEIILAKIHGMTQDESIEIQDIRRGCIELVLSGSPEGLKRLESLINSGELQDIAGVRIIGAESAVEPNKVVRLSNWLDDLVESGWQALEQFLSPQQLQLALRSDARTEFQASHEFVREDCKGKLIDRSMLDDGFAVKLTLQRTTLANGLVEIILRIYPTEEQTYLPYGIKLRMFCSDEDGNEVSTEMQANSEDEWVELHFAGEVEEKFAVEIVKGNVSVIENFVI